MIAVFKIIISISKIFIKTIIRSLYNYKYYNGVEFYNNKNIFIHKTVEIEKGSRIFANTSSVNHKTVSINSDCWIGRDVEIISVYNSDIIIDKNVSIQDRCKIMGDVFIGQNSLLAPDVFLSSGNHYFNHQPYLLIKEQDKLVIKNEDDFRRNSKKIFVGEDCWLGKNVMIASGVFIGRGAIIAANSFVNCNIPPYEIWGGTPAKNIGKRLEFIPPRELDSAQLFHLPYFYFGFDHKNITENGILSNNKSLCVLEKIIYYENLLLNLEILCLGHLKIFFNENLIFSDDVLIGPFEKKLDLVNSQISNSIHSSEILPQNIIAHNFVEFDFSPKKIDVKNGFLIKKIIIV